MHIFSKYAYKQLMMIMTVMMMMMMMMINDNNRDTFPSGQFAQGHLPKKMDTQIRKLGHPQHTLGMLVQFFQPVAIKIRGVIIILLLNLGKIWIFNLNLVYGQIDLCCGLPVCDCTSTRSPS